MRIKRSAARRAQTITEQRGRQPPCAHTASADVFTCARKVSAAKHSSPNNTPLRRQGLLAAAEARAKLQAQCSGGHDSLLQRWEQPPASAPWDPPARPPPLNDRDGRAAKCSLPCGDECAARCSARTLPCTLCVVWCARQRAASQQQQLLYTWRWRAAARQAQATPTQAQHTRTRKVAGRRRLPAHNGRMATSHAASDALTVCAWCVLQCSALLPLAPPARQL